MVAMGARVSAVEPKEAERLKSQLQDLFFFFFSQTVVFDRHILATLTHVFWGYMGLLGHFRPSTGGLHFSSADYMGGRSHGLLYLGHRSFWSRFEETLWKIYVKFC